MSFGTWRPRQAGITADLAISRPQGPRSFMSAGDGLIRISLGALAGVPPSDVRILPGPLDQVLIPPKNGRITHTRSTQIIGVGISHKCLRPTVRYSFQTALGPNWDCGEMSKTTALPYEFDKRARVQG